MVSICVCVQCELNVNHGETHKVILYCHSNLTFVNATGASASALQGPSGGDCEEVASAEFQTQLLAAMQTLLEKCTTSEQPECISYQQQAVETVSATIANVLNDAPFDTKEWTKINSLESGDLELAELK